MSTAPTSSVMTNRARAVVTALALFAALCGTTAPASAQQLACDDGIKTAFHPDEATTVVAVRAIKKGEELVAQDSPRPITMAADMCSL